MLKARDVEGQMVLGWDATTGQPYYCPECQDAVIFKRGTRVTPHFAHKPPVTCLAGIGESARHLEMKAALRFLVDTPIEYEVSLIPNHRADAVLPRYRIVIECQASKIAEAEWERRTSDYNRRGWSVLWLWDEKRLKQHDPLHWRRYGIGEYRIPAEILRCHKLSFGRAYILTSANAVKAGHFSAHERTSEWYDRDTGDYESSGYTPRTVRSIQWHPITSPLRFSTLSQETFKLAGLDDGVWWTTRKQRQQKRLDHMASNQMP